MKKYENTEIVLEIILEDKENNKKSTIFLRMDMKENGHRKTHDYLLAMALGCELKPVSIYSRQEK